MIKNTNCIRLHLQQPLHQSNIKSIENELIRFKAANEFNFINLETPLSNLPITIIRQNEIKVTIDEVSLINTF